MIMELKEIQSDKCPTCGSSPAVIGRNGVPHTNGHYEERIKFTCGSHLHFSPSSKRIEVDISCPNELKEKRRTAKRSRFVEKLMDMINDSKIDEEFKAKAKLAIRYL